MYKPSACSSVPPGILNFNVTEELHTLSAWAVAFSLVCIAGSLMLLAPGYKVVAGGAAMQTVGTLGFAAWTMGLNAMVYRDQGRACSFHFNPPVTNQEVVWHDQWTF